MKCLTNFQDFANKKRSFLLRDSFIQNEQVQISRNSIILSVRLQNGRCKVMCNLNVEILHTTELQKWNIIKKMIIL